METLASILGGIGLFLLGVWLMTEGLKLAAGPQLRLILGNWTDTRLRGLCAGILITAIVRSSSAVTVATVGFVNAGLLTLRQAIWVIYGTNIGTTTTSWLVVLVGVKAGVEVLALPLLGIGMIVRLVSGQRARGAGLGQAIAGFGAFFLGIAILQSGFAGLTPYISGLDLPGASLFAILGFILLGIVLTMVTQSSSAALAVALTASAGGAIPLELAAAAVIGTNIGTTSTALFSVIGATAPAKRVASAHIAFNLLTGLVALMLMPVLLWVSIHGAELVGTADDIMLVLAVFHTMFNCMGVALIWPLSAHLERFLSSLYRTPEEDIARPRHLDSTLLAVPDLALRGLVLEATRLQALAFALTRDRIAGISRSRGVAERQQGILALGRQIRDFAGQLGGQALPATVVDALPDLIRATQHLDEIVLAADQLAPLVAPMEQAALEGTEQGVARESWQRLNDAIAGTLPPPPEQGEVPGDIETLTALAAQIEENYQSIKAGLLRATATGRLHVGTMETALLQAQRLRHAATEAIKAQRRLNRWQRFISDNQAVAAEPPPEIAESADRPD
ncbi:Na/Pi cotransporter family protein [Oceanibaculum nanhaiense]|uniref:Na/Pi cotransporter family protein n=1 Tax=Oceanibaculum nanhaiense TaxID=1909734 RepID=UPI00396D0968